MSLHNHGMAHSVQVLEELDKIGLEDETIGHPFPRLPSEPAEFFHHWMAAEPSVDRGGPILSFFHFQRTWWEARRRPNVLFVHFNDLKADLSGEMRRVADFLGISVPEYMWPELVSMADFDAMRRDGDTLMAAVASLFQGGSQRFFFKGTNERWRGIFRDEDLALYDATAQAMLPPECAKWVASSRLESGDPA